MTLCTDEKRNFRNNFIHIFKLLSALFSQLKHGSPSPACLPACLPFTPKSLQFTWWFTVNITSGCDFWWCRSFSRFRIRVVDRKGYSLSILDSSGYMGTLPHGTCVDGAHMTKIPLISRGRSSGAYLLHGHEEIREDSRRDKAQTCNTVGGIFQGWPFAPQRVHNTRDILLKFYAYWAPLFRVQFLPKLSILHLFLSPAASCSGHYVYCRR